MAGSGGTPELAAAVSNAGGLGAWGGAYAKPDEIVAAIRRIRQLTSRPFNINLFAGGYASDRKVDPRPMLEIMRQAHARLGLPPPVLPPVPANPFDEQFAVVLEERPPVFSFTFGTLSAEQIAALKKRGIAISGTATTVEEARRLAQAGVDAIVAQGAEAGAHRGSFAAPFEASMIPVATLVRDIGASVALPVIASGGIMDGRDVAAAMKLRRRRRAARHCLFALPRNRARQPFTSAHCSKPRLTRPSSPAHSPAGRRAALPIRSSPWWLAASTPSCHSGSRTI